MEEGGGRGLALRPRDGDDPRRAALEQERDGRRDPCAARARLRDPGGGGGDRGVDDEHLGALEVLRDVPAQGQADGVACVDALEVGRGLLQLVPPLHVRHGDAGPLRHRPAGGADATPEEAEAHHRDPAVGEARGPAALHLAHRGAPAAGSAPAAARSASSFCGAPRAPARGPWPRCGSDVSSMNEVVIDPTDARRREQGTYRLAVVEAERVEELGEDVHREVDHQGDFRPSARCRAGSGVEEVSWRTP